MRAVNTTVKINPSAFLLRVLYIIELMEAKKSVLIFSIHQWLNPITFHIEVLLFISQISLFKIVCISRKGTYPLYLNFF